MDISKFKLGLGPMSKDIVDICLEYSKVYDYPIMLIASRNQVDFDYGYAFTTEEFTEYVRANKNYDPNRVLICRDHCGPYFSDADQSLSLDQAVERCISTIRADIKAGFDLIHIDVGRITGVDNQESIATELFDFALSLNPNIMFEFGSEDNTSTNIDDSLSNLHRQLEFTKKYKNNLKFFVTQTGSLTKHTQMGSFDKKMNLSTAEQIHSYGLLFKEHNGDYLKETDILLRKESGVDSVNIAPQLGYIQSSVLYSCSNKSYQEFTDFFDTVVNSNYWKKWVVGEDIDDTLKFRVSAHYMYSDQGCRAFMEKIKNIDNEFSDTLRKELFSTLDNYRNGLVI
jgi:tagatose-1,6-bisphosphate aldolase non-catalytic subunit AgaZ/GatZ